MTFGEWNGDRPGEIGGGTAGPPPCGGIAHCGAGSWHVPAQGVGARAGTVLFGREGSCSCQPSPGHLRQNLPHQSVEVRRRPPWTVRIRRGISAQRTREMSGPWTKNALHRSRDDVRWGWAGRQRSRTKNKAGRGHHFAGDHAAALIVFPRRARGPACGSFPVAAHRRGQGAPNPTADWLRQAGPLPSTRRLCLSSPPRAGGRACG